MVDRKDIQNARKQLGLDRMPAVLGDGSGQPRTADGKYWVRKVEAGGLAAPVKLPLAAGASMTVADGVACEIGWDEKRQQVIYPASAQTLQASGINPLTVNPLDAIIQKPVKTVDWPPFLCKRHGDTLNKPLTVVVYVPPVVTATNIVLPNVLEADLSSFVPAADLRCFALVFWLDDNTLEVQSSTPVSLLDPLTDADLWEAISASTADSIPVWAWVLQDGQTELSSDPTKNMDIRQFVNMASTGGGGTVTSVSGTAPIASSGGATPSISLNDTAVTPGSYTNTSLTVDQKGRLTAASSGAAPAPADATYITQTANAGLSNEQALSSLATGHVRVTTGTGVLTSVKDNIGAAVAPTVNEDSGDGYEVGSRWYDTTADIEYVCLDATVGAAVWEPTTGDGTTNPQFSANTTQTIANTAAETTLFGSGVGTLTIPANRLEAGGVILVELSGVYSTKANPVGNITFRMKLGGSTLCASVATGGATSITDRTWNIVAWITCQAAGVSGQIIGQGGALLSTGNNSSQYLGMPGSLTPVTLDTTGALTLDVTFEWATADTANTISCTNSIVLITPFSGGAAGGAGGSGTVTSVALTASPTGIFDVSGSPIIGAGTLALSLDTQTANTVLAGAVSGGAATPAFRALVSDDLPTVPITKGGTGQTTQTAGMDALSPTTTKGDLLVDNGTNVVRFPVGATDGDVLTVDSSTATGLAYAPPATTALQFSQTADKTHANSTTETTLFGTGAGTLTLPANALAIGRSLRIQLMGHWSSHSAPGTITVTLKLGGVTVAISVAITPTASVVQRSIKIDALIHCRTVGATGTVIGQGNIILSNGNTANLFVGMPATAAVVVDTTGTLAVDVTWDWSVANAANSITITNATVELLEAA